MMSCKENCTEYLLGNFKNTNPYIGTESLIFYMSNGDSLMFLGQGRRSWMNKNTEYDCRIIEMDDCSFISNEANYGYIISLRPNTNHSDAEIRIIVNDYTYSDRWHYNSRSYFNLPLSSENLNPGQEYFDSLLVLDHYFYDVYASNTILDRTPTRKEMMKDTVHPSMIYYNIEYGIVKVDFDDGSTWELKEIIP